MEFIILALVFLTALGLEKAPENERVYAARRQVRRRRALKKIA